jgi:hypothetical protein
MSFVEASCRSPTNSSAAIRLPLRSAPQETSIREAVLGLGRTIISGCIAAAAAMSGHQLLACELDHAPKPLAALSPIATVERKPAKIVAPQPRVRLERRQPVYVAVPFPSRRIILQ